MGFSGVISTTSPKSSAYDVSARGFFIAQSDAGVTLTDTQKNATNQLVIDLKAAGLWSKFKAVYPMVGGTATSHKFNLITPADTDAAFRLQFFGGWTHSANGALPNGVDAYADTFFIPATNGTLNSSHVSYYSRTDANGLTDIGANNSLGTAGGTTMYIKLSGTYKGNNDVYPTVQADYAQYTNSNSLGLYINSRTASNLQKAYKNGITQASSTSTGNRTNRSLYLAAMNKDNPVAVADYGNHQCAFASIGDGLSDLESQLFYQITEKYQVALGRNVNATQSFYYNSAYNNETNAFLFSTQITDNTIQTATNTLVTDLKTAGVFTKMKALYPMVGGTATTHKFNLVNAQDSAAAFALSFVGGWTHSANGALPNGTNAYANTFFIPSVNGMSLNSAHISYYSRTNTSAYMVEMGNYDAATNSSTLLLLRNVNTASIRMNNLTLIDYSNTDSLGLHISNRTASNVITGWKNGIKKITSAVASTVLPANPIYIGAFRDGTGTNYYSTKQCAFASIGDGLSDAEALALYNAVNAFQVSLARNV